MKKLFLFAAVCLLGAFISMLGERPFLQEKEVAQGGEVLPVEEEESFFEEKIERKSAAKKAMEKEYSRLEKILE